MSEPLTITTMRPREALLISLLIVAVMGITMIGFGWVPHISIVLVMCGLFAYGRFKGAGFDAMQKSMAEGVVSGIGAIYLFFYIGLLVAALMMSGAIPTLMYYGFDLISPHFFYISAFVLCSVIGISLDSGFTTCATAGVAFLGMAEAFDANPAMQQQLVASGLVHGYALLPFAVLIVLAVRKVNAIYTIIATIFTAIAVTYIHSSPTLGQLGGWFFSGYKPAEGLDLGTVGKLVSRGGMESMFFSQTIVVLALSLGGLLQGLGVLPALLAGVTHLLTGVGRATAAAAATAFGINFLIGEQYLSLLLTGNTFKPLYERLNLHPRNLARTIEDSGTVINPLVPWGVYGVFLAGILGVPVVDYVPYAFFCYLSLILTLIYGFTGFTISRLPQEQAS